MKVNKKKIEDFRYLRNKTILFGLFMLVVIISCAFIIKFSIIRKDEEINTVYSYLVDSSVNYKVRYKPNDFFEEKVLGMDKQYATDLVNVIEVTFNNNLKISKEALVEYDYEILGLIEGTYSSDNSRKETELWKRNFTLLEKRKGKVSKKTSNINEKLEIDFNYFNNIAVEFKRQLKLNIDAKFTAKMIVNYKIYVKDKVEDVQSELILEYPLNKAAFVIDTDVPKGEKQVITEVYDGDIIINYPVLTAAIIFLTIAFVLLIKYILRIRLLTMKTEYQKELNKILKNFGDIIAESKTPIDLTKYEVLEIHDFNDMVDIENEVRIPIIYYEKKAGIEGWFTLVHNDIAYRYILYTRSHYRYRDDDYEVI